MGKTRNDWPSDIQIILKPTMSFCGAGISGASGYAASDSKLKSILVTARCAYDPARMSELPGVADASSSVIKTFRLESLIRLTQGVNAHGPNLCRYSVDVMKALTISALTKLPLN